MIQLEFILELVYKKEWKMFKTIPDSEDCPETFNS